MKIYNAPWSIFETTISAGIKDNDGYIVAGGDSHEGWLDPNCPKTILISCAPEMLDMLINDYKFFVLWYENNTDESLKRRLEKKVLDKKELIEKATGLTIEEVLKNE